MEVILEMNQKPAPARSSLDAGAAQKNAVSIVDVAKLAGVGVGTVSRVINNKPSVSRAKSEAVRAAMRALDYSPPPPGKRRGFRISHGGAKSPACHVILMILSNYGLDWILAQAPVYASVLQGIQSRATASGGSFSIRQAGNWGGVMSAARENRAAACLVMGNEPAEEPPEALALPNVVWVMGSVHRFSGDHIQPDHFSLGQLAAGHIQRMGHRSAAYIGQPVSPLNHVSFRAAAFEWWLGHHGISTLSLCDADVVETGPRVHRANERVLTRLVEVFAHSRPRPTALLLQADVLAPLTYELLRSHGIEPMRDVEILTCNHELAYLSHLKPQPVILDLQAEAIGRRAVDQAFWRLSHPTEPAMRLMIEPILLKPSDFQT